MYRKAYQEGFLDIDDMTAPSEIPFGVPPSMQCLNHLLQGFGAGELSLDELWVNIDRAFDTAATVECCQ